MDRVFVLREFNDEGFSLRISVSLPVEIGNCEWKANYEIEFNGATKKGYSLGIDSLDALVNAIAEVRRGSVLLSKDSRVRSWHLVPYIAPTVDRAFDEYVESLVKSARDYYWKHKSLPPLPSL